MSKLYDTPQARLMDLVASKLDVKNDAHLSRLLHTQPPVVSKLRSQKLWLGPAMIVCIHEVTDIPVREIKAIAGQKSLPSARQVSS